MKAYKRKISVAVSTMLVIIGLAGRASAFPLPTMDIKGVMTQVQTYMTLVQEVQGTVMRIQHIIKEIQHGGFGAAVSDLFGMIESGEFDRFGNNLKTLSSMAQADLYNVQTGMKASKEARQMRREGASKEAIAEAKQKTIAERQRAYEEKQRNKEKAKEADTSRKKSAVSNAYNWLKENRQVTSAVRTGAMAAQYGDVAGMVSSAAMGAGGVLASGDRELVKDENGNIIGEKKTGNQVAGDILTNTAGYLGGATYAVQRGDYVGALTTAATAAGAGLATSGKETSAGIVTNAAQAAGAAAQTVQHGVQNGANVLQMGTQVITNPYIQQSVINTGDYAVSSYNKKQQEKEAAAHEAYLANTIAQSDNADVQKYANMSKDEYNSNKEKIETLKQDLHKQADAPMATDKQISDAQKALEALKAIEEVQAGKPTLEQQIRSEVNASVNSSQTAPTNSRTTQQNSQATQPQASNTQNTGDKTQKEKQVQNYMKFLMNQGKNQNSVSGSEAVQNNGTPQEQNSHSTPTGL